MNMQHYGVKEFPHRSPKGRLLRRCDACSHHITYCAEGAHLLQRLSPDIDEGKHKCHGIIPLVQVMRMRQGKDTEQKQLTLYDFQPDVIGQMQKELWC